MSDRPSLPSAPLRLLGVGFTALILPLSAWGQEPPDTASVTQDTTRVTLSGKVIDAATREPVGRVTLRFPTLDITLVSDENGEFEPFQIQLGTYLLSLARHGYKVASGDFTVRQAGSFVFELNPLTIPASAEPSRVVGQVTDRETGQPLSTTRVTVQGRQLDALTSSDGRFEFARVPPGTQVVRVEHLGYGTREDSVYIPAGRTIDLQVEIGVQPIRVEGFTVSVEARDRFLEAGGFYQRRDWGWGKQWSREQILEKNPVFLADLIREVPGLTTEDSEFVRRVYSRRRASFQSTACQLAVYIDGVVTADFDIDSLDPFSLQAFEVYHGQEVPLEYLHHCGVILIWTR